MVFPRFQLRLKPSRLAPTESSPPSQEATHIVFSGIIPQFTDESGLFKLQISITLFLRETCLWSFYAGMCRYSWAFFCNEVMFSDCSKNDLLISNQCNWSVWETTATESPKGTSPSINAFWTFVDVTFRVVKQTLSTSDLSGTVEGKENLRETRTGTDTGTHGDTHNQWKHVEREAYLMMSPPLWIHTNPK